MYRSGITNALPGGTAWVKITGMERIASIKDFAVFHQNIWIIDQGNEHDSGKVWFGFIGKNVGQPSVFDLRTIDGQEMINIVADSSGNIWSLGTDGKVYIREGIGPYYPYGKQWIPILNPSERRVFQIYQSSPGIFAVLPMSDDKKSAGM